MRLLSPLAALAFFGPLASCGGGRFDGARFEKQTVAYRVGELPGGWERIEVEDQDLAFAHAGLGTIGVHALCEAYDDLPHAALLNHLFFGFTHRRYLTQEEVVLDGRGALHALVDAELDGVPVRAEVYILTRNGCVFDLLHVRPRPAPGQGDPGRTSFSRFVRGFAIERAGSSVKHSARGRPAVSRRCAPATSTAKIREIPSVLRRGARRTGTQKAAYGVFYRAASSE